eukprot:CAMPEP_0184697816 /NCGR_PEP_ID=MMETSP0313-20130426/4645_1 /TAXON_ID=2792 /ORGANISM="Porphyridium aerugineum, Strain SAG 1380-2" /LENGTH=590 /DNA_ID=CAMNT_0027156653 /DNA_START=40 /DNA_END=1812 /DNA_ORIENTATION=+
MEVPTARFDLQWILNTIFSNDQVASYLVSRDPLPPVKLERDVMSRSMIVNSFVTTDPEFTSTVLHKTDFSGDNELASPGNQDEQIVYLCHRIEQNLAFMTETDARTPFSFLETVAPLVAGVRRLVSMKLNKPGVGPMHILCTYYWQQDGKSSLVILCYMWEPVIYSEKYCVLLKEYPDHRYPRMEDVLEFVVGYDEFLCPFCTSRGLSSCVCPKSMAQRRIPQLPARTERDPWTLQQWSWGIHERGLKKYTMVLKNIAQNVSCAAESYHETASFNNSEARVKGFDMYLDTLRSYFDPLMIAWGNISSPKSLSVSAGRHKLLEGIEPSNTPLNSHNIELLDRDENMIQIAQVGTKWEENPPRIQAVDDEPQSRKREIDVASCEPSPDTSFSSRLSKRRRAGMSIHELCHPISDEQPEKSPMPFAEHLTLSSSAQRSSQTPAFAAPSSSDSAKHSNLPHNQQRITMHEHQIAAANSASPNLDEASIQAYLKELDLTPWPANHTQTCLHCDVTYYRKQDLKRHIQSMRDGVSRPFACLQCPMTFTRKSHMQVHMSGFHNRSNELKCKYCDRTFKYESSKYKHQHSVHKELMKK